MSDTPTPRTDAEEFWHECKSDGSCIKVVTSEFARQLERELAAQSWQPIETAPKDGTIVLGWSGGAAYPVRFKDTPDWLYGWQLSGVCWYDESSSIKPTHWRAITGPNT